MAKLFDYDNPIWRFMGRVADLFFLTLLWVVCSLPVITLGASTSALYYVMLKVAKNQDGYLCRSYLRAFRDNFVQSTAVWAALSVVGAVLGLGLWSFHAAKTPAAALGFWTFFVLAVWYLLEAVLIFPLTARLDTGTKDLFLMAFMVGVKNFSWVLLMLVTTICVTAVGIFVFWPVLLVGAGVTAYIHSMILVWMIFPQYGWNETPCQEA